MVTAPEVADLNVWTVVLDAGAVDNTCTVIVVEVVESIGIAVLHTGSPVRGYVWSVAWLSSAQVNVNELVAILIRSPTIWVWLPMVISIKPLVGL